jgi:hypothetical protein
MPILGSNHGLCFYEDAGIRCRRARMVRSAAFRENGMTRASPSTHRLT